VNVVVTSEPAGATVTVRETAPASSPSASAGVAGTPVGETPATLPVSLAGAPSKRLTLEVTRVGHRPATVEVEVTSAKEGGVELVHVRLERLGRGGPTPAASSGRPAPSGLAAPGPGAPAPRAPAPAKDPFDDL
jgi:hypothetical protein